MLGETEVLASDLRPLRVGSLRPYASVVAKSIATGRQVHIVTGYFGVESVIELIGILRGNPLEREVIFTVGMAAFDGLTHTQIDALKELDNYLASTQQGQVLISVALPVHSKISSVVLEDGTHEVIVGSSNFTNLISGVRQFETDVLLDGSSQAGQKIVELISEVERTADPLTLAESRIKVLKAKLPSLAAERDVEQASPISGETLVEFTLPIKTEPKSSLNAYFGKGRVDSKGRVLPRPWYEVELIVSKSITSLPNYPQRDEVITVITDDGWKFNCHSTGDYAKNFRSHGNLEILGKWIKGRLEEYGALQPGCPVSDDVLKIYGNHELRLVKHKNGDWSLSFPPKKGEK